MTTTYYISGPMRGYEHFNFPAFMECEEYLRDVFDIVTDFNILNPAQKDIDEGFDYSDELAGRSADIPDEMMHRWMRRDISDVAASDTIILLPGWEKSEGARRELSVAKWCGLAVDIYDPSADHGYRLTPMLWDELADLCRQADAEKALGQEILADKISNYTEVPCAQGCTTFVGECPLKGCSGKPADFRVVYDEILDRTLETVAQDTEAELLERLNSEIKLARKQALPGTPTLPVQGNAAILDRTLEIAEQMEQDYAEWGHRNLAEMFPKPSGTGEVRTVSASGGAKGVKPERHDLVPVGPMDDVARVYAFGAEKYDDHNWRKGYEWGKSYAALQRHVRAFWSGNDEDEESGLPHLAHAAFHLFALLEWSNDYERYAQFDDRYLP